jgi:hypothetical protein
VPNGQLTAKKAEAKQKPTPTRNNTSKSKTETKQNIRSNDRVKDGQNQRADNLFFFWAKGNRVLY